MCDGRVKTVLKRFRGGAEMRLSYTAVNIVDDVAIRLELKISLAHKGEIGVDRWTELAHCSLISGWL